MGKQTDATVYYCDNCHKSIVGTANILKEAEFLAVAHGIAPDQKQVINELPFSSTMVNKFVIPSLETEVMPHTNDVNMDCGIKINPKTIYYCKDCAEKISQKYIELCNEINNLF